MSGYAIDDEIAVLQWWNELRATNNEAFMPLFLDESRYLVLCGGGGSGKSIFAGRKVLERVTSEPGHRWLVVRKVAKTLRQSCFAQLISQAREHHPGRGLKVNKSDMILSFDNGSEILFAGLDDVEKLKSIFDITGVWIEEASELEESDFNQLDIRLRTNFDEYLQIILTFNPIHINHWLKKRFFDKAEPKAATHRSTYRDNRFLSDEAIAVLEGFKDSDEYYYTVYCLGEWGVTGKTVFNAKAIARRLAELAGKKPLRTGFFEYDEASDGMHISNIRWTEDAAGPIRIYREPIEERPYVIGGDTAGEGSDFFTGQCIDNITGEQVCTLRHRYDEDTYARQMYCLGHYYNEALLGIETNFSTYPVKLIEKMGYRRLYVREVADTYTGAIKQAFGFRTDGVTRPVIIGDLIRLMREGLSLINDETTLHEMSTFVRNEKLRPEAEPGAFDDTVIALAIAYHIRPQQTAKPMKDASRRTKWSADMWEDYRAASAAEKKYLLEKWGEPQ